MLGLPLVANAFYASILGAVFIGIMWYTRNPSARQVADGQDVLELTVDGQIELSGAVGRMIAALLLGLAEIELEFRAERQRAGIEAAQKRGVYLGRRKGTTKAKPDRAAELRAKGLQLDEIATALGTSRRTVQRYLAVQ